MPGINTSTSSYRFSKHQNLLIQGELCPNQHKSHPTMSKYQEHFYSPIPSTRKLSTLLLPIPAKYQSALRRLERYLNTTGKLQLGPNQIPILKSLWIWSKFQSSRHLKHLLEEYSLMTEMNFHLTLITITSYPDRCLLCYHVKAICVQWKIYIYWPR